MRLTLHVHHRLYVGPEAQNSVFNLDDLFYDLYSPSHNSIHVPLFFCFITHSGLSCWVFWSMSICDTLMGMIFIQPSCSSFFQQIWLLLLQYFKLPFHCQEEIGFSISRSFFSPSFPCFTGSSAGTWGGGSQRITLAHGQLCPPPSPRSQTQPATSRWRNVHMWMGRGLSPPSGIKPWALAQCCEQRVCGRVSDPLISANCFISNILLFYPFADLLMLKIWFGRWSLPCCW